MESLNSPVGAVGMNEVLKAAMFEQMDENGRPKYSKADIYRYIYLTFSFVKKLLFLHLKKKSLTQKILKLSLRVCF